MALGGGAAAEGAVWGGKGRGQWGKGAWPDLGVAGDTRSALVALVCHLQGNKLMPWQHPDHQAMAPSANPAARMQG